ncbi:MAG: hypothetical protein JXR70_07760 [Spirochaetales bacterium]|nr:hypothetical protein [Spirochaetales bacterium]
MKNFLIWLVIALLGFGLFFAVSHVLYSAKPKRVFIGIDASQATDPHKRSISQKLLPWLNQRYCEYALATNVLNKNHRLVHSWKSVADLGRVMDINMYTDLPLSAFSEIQEAQEAGEVLIVTTVKNPKDIKLQGAEFILLP